MSDKFTDNEERELNILFNDKRINDPKKTVKIVALVNNHDIRKESEVKEQIENHLDNGCDKDSCSLVANGTIQSQSKEMYEAQEDFFGYKKYDQDIIHKYVYDVFTTRTISGVDLESRAIENLNDEISFDVRKADEELDNDYSVDLVVSSDGTDFAGIQVKPRNYDKIQENMKVINDVKNTEYNHPVFYLYYKNDELQNLGDIINQIESLALDIATGRQELTA